MKFISTLIIFISMLSLAHAQEIDVSVPIDTFDSKIHIEEINGTVKFRSELRPLVQVPGGRAPYYTYLWDFGDGHFSTQAEPIHSYDKPGDYPVTVYAVNNYDDGAKPKRPVRTIRPGTTSNIANRTVHPFEQNFFSSNGVFQIFKQSDAKPGEDISLVVGVHTAGKKGKVYILSNEKIAGLEGFKFAHQSQYYQEQMDSIVQRETLHSMWANVSQSTFTKTGSPDYGIKEISTFTNSQQAITYFKKLYESYRSLSAYDVDPTASDTQFSLINLDITENMLVDTNAIVTITGVFIPEDGIANVHQVDIPVVKSHDPNKMSIKPARMNYRLQKKNKTMTYKVQFQNDGEGDAKNVRLEMTLPEEIDKSTFELQALYPQCDTCQSSTSRGCYQYYEKADGTFVFHFKDIALPGTAAKDITDMDSTKGFILFSVETHKKLKNKSFKAYTNIYFDNNPPIKTNTATSRFRKIWSPIVTVGTSHTFGTPVENEINYRFRPGIQLGFGIAPLAPYKKPYWQVEFYTSYYKQNGSRTITDIKGEMQIGTSAAGRPTILIYDRIEETYNRDYISLQVPMQIRYNFNSFISVGAGVSARADINTNVFEKEAYIGQYLSNEQQWESMTYEIEDEQTTKKNSPIKINPFFDINVGRVYLGPALGFRLSYDTTQKTIGGIYGLWRF